MSNFSKDFVVEIDVSRFEHECRPIAFISKVFSICNKGKLIYEQELMVIIMTSFGEMF